MCHLVLVFNLYCCSSATVGRTRHQSMDTALCTVCSCLLVSPCSSNKFRETSLFKYVSETCNTCCAEFRLQ